MRLQRTIRKPIQIVGVGLHSGKTARVVLKPGRPNRGIVFVRTDLETPVKIEASFENVVDTQLATTLGKGKVTISTVEHLLAAVAGFGIDNLIIEVNGPEVPVMDGSSAEFCKQIERVGLETQLAPRAFLRVLRRVEVQNGDKYGVIEPSHRFEISSTIDWDHPAIGKQELRYAEGLNSFSELATARTFGFLKDVETLKKMGLAKGGSLDNAIVLDDQSVMNPGGLRSKDEFVRHKVLDAIGDLKLAGLPIQGYFRLHRSGHGLHRELLAALFADPANYEIVGGSLHESIVRLREALVPATA